MDTVRLNSNLTLYAVWASNYNINVAKGVTGGKLVPEETTYIASEETQVINMTIAPDSDYFFAGATLKGSDNEDALFFRQGAAGLNRISGRRRQT
jgi:hypothetical protein